ncbi:hypothetical protein [Paenibacillus sp. Soil787]|nr:hypothetical protein [Paenibacillus sp. Soil787]
MTQRLNYMQQSPEQRSMVRARFAFITFRYGGNRHCLFHANGLRWHGPKS